MEYLQLTSVQWIKAQNWGKIGIAGKIAPPLF